MRITACLGCWIVALDCAQKAVGSLPQDMFAAPNIWMWWVVALFWGTSGLRLLLAGAA